MEKCYELQLTQFARENAAEDRRDDHYHCDPLHLFSFESGTPTGPTATKEETVVFLAKDGKGREWFVARDGWRRMSHESRGSEEGTSGLFRHPRMMRWSAWKWIEQTASPYSCTLLPSLVGRSLFFIADTPDFEARPDPSRWNKSRILSVCSCHDMCHSSRFPSPPTCPDLCTRAPARLRGEFETHTRNYSVLGFR